MSDTTRINLPNGMIVECHGRYGGDGCTIAILDESEAEIVMWNDDEWADEPTLMATIFGFMAFASPSELVETLGKTEIEDENGFRSWI